MASVVAKMCSSALSPYFFAGDDVHVKIRVPKLGDAVGQRIGGEAVAHEEDPGIVLAGDGAQHLDRAAGAEIGAADADDHEGLRAAADQFGRSEDARKLGILDALGQLHPTGEVRAEAGLACERLMAERGKCVIGAGAGEEFLRAGEIYFNHIGYPP